VLGLLIWMPAAPGARDAGRHDGRGWLEQGPFERASRPPKLSGQREWYGLLSGHARRARSGVIPQWLRQRVESVIST